MLKRLLERGKTSGREDDNTETIKKRFGRICSKVQKQLFLIPVQQLITGRRDPSSNTILAQTRWLRYDPIHLMRQINDLHDED